MAIGALFDPFKVFLILILFFIQAISYGATSLEGGWKGTWDTGMTQFRVALVFQKDSSGLRGTFNNIDEGQYELPLQKIKTTERSIRAELSTGEVFDLNLDPSGSRLEGTCRQVPGHFEKPGVLAPVRLSRGMDFLIPRMSPDGKVQILYSYLAPSKKSDDWEVGDLKGIRSDLLSVGLQKAVDGTFPHIHSVVVAQGGKLLVDEYFYGYGPEDEHPLHSVTKSVFSILVGIATGQGLLKPEESLYDHFPEYRTRPGWKAAKDKVTLRTLLTMTSGFACDDWKNSTACSWSMVDSPDWLDFSLSEPLDHEPGEHFAYCGACLTPLSVLLARQSRMTVPQFAQRNLFERLGIPSSPWMEGPQGVTPPAFGLKMRPRDLAKLGALYLQKGTWKGKEIVPKTWVEGSLSALVPASQTHGKGDYGFLWWAKDMKVRKKNLRVHFAWGVGGQYLFLVPALDLVCVVTAGNENDSRLGTNSLRLFEEYVLPTFIGPSSGQN